MKQYFVLGFVLLTLNGCTTTPVTLKGKQVDIVWNVETTSQQCQLKSTLVGSEGSWYNFWLLANDSLVEGALNQLRNQAASVGANTVLLGQPVPYASSVTYIAMPITARRKNKTLNAKSTLRKQQSKKNRRKAVFF